MTTRRTLRTAALKCSAAVCLVLLSFPVALLTRAAAAAKPEAKATSTNAVPEGENWKTLFDGKSLKGWAITDFAGHGEVKVESSFKVKPSSNAVPVIILDMGAALTGITWTNPPPKGEYEISLEAAKVEGSDFFCGLTFPAGGDHCSLIVGGWGGGVVGISSIDSMDASENETTKFMSFEKDRWYVIRVRVTDEKIQAWIDRDKMADVAIKDRRISVRAGEIELSQPLGIATYQTRAAIRNIRMRSL